MRVEVYPAGDGDCFLLSYGDDPRYVLIDGGRRGAYRMLRPRLAALALEGKSLSLFVLTHIDADHIEGVLAFAEDDHPAIPVQEVWYNGFDQMSEVETLGEGQGEDFSAALARLGWPWNTTFGGHVIQVEGHGAPFKRDGLGITLVSPDAQKLRAMRDRWAEWRTEQAAKAAADAVARDLDDLPDGVEVLGPKPMPLPLDVPALATPTKRDPEAPNGSSIAFLAAADERRILLTGDAHPDLLVRTLTPIAAAEGGKVTIDLLKVSHHGSKGNTSAELLALLDCRRFLFSTNGSHHGHPDPQAVARVLMAPASDRRTLYFNYRSAWTVPWDDAGLKATYDYDCVFGTNGRMDIEI